MAVKCPQCGATFLPGVRYCSRCRVSLPAEAKSLPVEGMLLPAEGKKAKECDLFAQNRAGVVYLLRFGSYYKIGKSTVPEKRYGQLKIQLPEKPELIHEIQTNDVDYVELHWHKRFKPQRKNGEWFSLRIADVEEFKQCKSMEIDRA